MRRLPSALTVVLAVVVLVATASFAEAGLLSKLNPNGSTRAVSDNDADIGAVWDPDSDNGAYVKSTGDLLVNDFLVAGISFALIDNTISLVGDGVNGLAILKIASLSGPDASGFHTFTFKAPTTTEWADIVDDLLGGGSALKKSTAGGLIMIFDNATNDFQPGTADGTYEGESLVTSAGRIATGGTELFEFGFTGSDSSGNVVDNNTGEGWAAVGPVDPTVGQSIDMGGAAFGAISFGLTVLEVQDQAAATHWMDFILRDSPLFDGGGQAEVTGFGGLGGYQDDNDKPAGPWHIGTQADFWFRPTPEPSSIVALLGMAVAVLTLGWLRKRARK